MATGDGDRPDPLTQFERLSNTPEKHHIFHAFRILEAAYPDAPRIGDARRPREDKVRFGQEAELRFPPSTIASFKPGDGQRPARLTNRFFGLFGPQGPLPLHMTEYARERLRHHRDPTFIEFANILTHRLMTLLYRAWRSGQPAPSFDRGENDGVERKVASIAGYHGKHLRGSDAFPDLAKRHFAGLLAQGAKNAEGLEAILNAFFGVPVIVKQFVGSWLRLEPDDCWQLDGRSALGRTTSIGEKVWSRSSKFRLQIGPLDLAQYQSFLPGRSSLDSLRDIVRNYCGDAMDWDVNLVLRAEDVPQAKLGETARLGQISWIGERRSDKDAADLFLEINASAVHLRENGGTKQ